MAIPPQTRPNLHYELHHELPRRLQTSPPAETLSTLALCCSCDRLTNFPCSQQGSCQHSPVKPCLTTTHTLLSNPTLLFQGKKAASKRPGSAVPRQRECRRTGPQAQWLAENIVHHSHAGRTHYSGDKSPGNPASIRVPLFLATAPQPSNAVPTITHSS